MISINLKQKENFYFWLLVVFGISISCGLYGWLRTEKQKREAYGYQSEEQLEQSREQRISDRKEARDTKRSVDEALQKYDK